MKDIFILQIETATPVCSVAISNCGETIVVVDAPLPNMHASSLTGLIEQALREAGLSMSQLHAIAVSMGPGSYTGLRIGVSTAKGLCYGLDIPLLAVDTLDAMNGGFAKTEEANTGSIFVPMIDARRMEVYTAHFNDQGLKTQETQARIIDSNSFDSNSENYILFGSGADKFVELFATTKNVAVVSGFLNSGAHLSKLSYDRYELGKFEDLIYFEPFYLKDFIASTPKQR